MEFTARPFLPFSLSTPHSHHRKRIENKSAFFNVKRKRTGLPDSDSSLPSFHFTERSIASPASGWQSVRVKFLIGFPPAS